ncbi:MAG TPA: protease pro-enzyme activation domain-containing protein, partial [Acidimicrobiales bacterium]|nr:protease pro-enzyme activation domain-containing protein [Acidimicrobiales bacterium]
MRRRARHEGAHRSHARSRSHLPRLDSPRLELRPAALVALLATMVVAACALGAGSGEGRPAAAGGSSPTRAAIEVGGWGRSASGTGVVASRNVALDLELRPRNEAALLDLIASQRTPASPQFHRWLTPAGFARRFGPGRAELAAVQAWAAGAGFRVEREGAGLAFSAPAWRVEAALRTRIVAGRRGLATTSRPSMPAQVAADVAALWTPGGPTGAVPLLALPGRTTRPAGAATAGAVNPVPATAGAVTAGTAATVTATPLGARRLAPGRATRPQASGAPQSCAAASSEGPSFTSAGVHYGVDTLQDAGDLGQGETIGLFELAGFSMGDIDAFESCLGVSTEVTALQVGVGDPLANLPYGGEDSEEVELDVEQAIAQAPGAHIVVYEGSSQYAVWQAIVEGATVDGDDVAVAPDGYAADPSLDVGEQFSPPQVVSVSWGWPWQQPATTSPVQQADDPLFEQAAAEGQAVFAASGDSGSSGGILYPSDSPFVTGVGGSEPEASGPDTAWGPSTGGFSPVEDEPAWQDDVETE